MAFSLRFHPADRLAVIRLGPSLVGPDLVRATDALLLDDAWVPTFRVVWDWRGVRELVLLPDDVEALRRRTQELARRLGPGQTAFLVAREDDAITAVMLGLRARRHPKREREVFRRVTEAAAWLGVSPRLLRGTSGGRLKMGEGSGEGRSH